MNYEEKISELETRLVKLEKIEKRRRIKSIISLVIYLIIASVFIYFGIRVYGYYQTYMKKLEELSRVQEKLDLNNIKEGISLDFLNDLNLGKK